MFELEEKIVALLNDAVMPLEAKYYVIQAIQFRLKEALQQQNKGGGSVGEETQE